MTNLVEQLKNTSDSASFLDVWNTLKEMPFAILCEEIANHFEPKEVWKEVAIFETRLEVSNLGNIRHKGKPENIRVMLKSGVAMISFYVKRKEGEIKTNSRTNRSVSQFVWATFGNPDSRTTAPAATKQYLHHRDGNPLNNNINNLYLKQPF